jgi:hypothetical protein
MSYIGRKYNNNGANTIMMTGGNCGCSSCLSGGRRMKNVRKMKGGRRMLPVCNCPECLQGGNIFDTLANWIPTAASFIPLVGKPVSMGAQAVLDALDPIRQNPQRPRRPTQPLPPPPPVFQPTKETGKYLTSQFNQAISRPIRLPDVKGAGFMDWVKKHKKPILGVLGSLGLAGLSAYGINRQLHKPVDRSSMSDFDDYKELYGSGFVDWVKKNKKPILNALGVFGVASLGALGIKKAKSMYDRNKWFNENVGADGYVDV